MDSLGNNDIEKLSFIEPIDYIVCCNDPDSPRIASFSTRVELLLNHLPTTIHIYIYTLQFASGLPGLCLKLSAIIPGILFFGGWLSHESSLSSLLAAGSLSETAGGDVPPSSVSLTSGVSLTYCF